MINPISSRDVTSQHSSDVIPSGSIRTGVANFPNTLVSLLNTDSEDCCSFVGNICNKAVSEIGVFFTHLCIDVKMLWQAVACLARGVTQEEVDLRQQRLSQFLSLIQQTDPNGIIPPAQQGQIRRVFDRLPEDVHFLLHIDRDYIQRFLAASNVEEMAQMREEIIRQSELALSYHERLGILNAMIYRLRNPSEHESVAETSVTNPTPMPRWDWRDLMRRLMGRRGETSPDDEVAQARSVLSSITAPDDAPVINLNILGTAPYHVPLSPQVLTNQQEIIRLKTLYDDMIDAGETISASRAVGAECQCLIMREFMEIPIFDASHPQVQTDISRTDLSPIDRFTHRHHVDKSSYEHMVGANRTAGNPNRCPQCRHPDGAPGRAGNRNIIHDHLRIDVELQRHIIAELKKAVGETP